MNVGVSALFIRPGRVGGVEQALYAALTAIDSIDGDHTLTVFAYPDTAAIISTLGLSRRVVLDVFERKAAINRFVDEATLLPRALKRHACDVVWFPNYFLPPTIRIPSVVTIHDLQYRHLPHYVSLRKRLWLDYTLSNTIRRASVVTTISDWSAQDIARSFGRRPNVVPNALNRDVFEGGKRPRQSSDVFRLLVIAHQYPHKNVPTVIRAFGELDPSLYRLDVIGQRSRGTDDIQHAIQTLSNAHNVVQHGYVARDRLLDLLANADLFLFPSTFEGFGIPVVEALAMGVPVIASDLPVLREVSRGAAYFVNDFLDPRAWAAAIAGMQDRITAGEAGIQTSEFKNIYGPESIGRKYLAAFESALSRVE